MTQTQKRRGRNGVASLGVDGEYLRIRFPKEFSLKTWGRPQAYFYTGIIDGPKGRPFAEKLLKEIQDDMASEILDPTFEKYRNKVVNFKSFFLKIPGYTNPLQHLVGLLFKDDSLSAVYKEYLDYKKRCVEETTFLDSYGGKYKRAIDNCPQDLNKPNKIVNHIMDNHTPGSAKLILRVIHEMVKWAKDGNIIEQNIPNPYGNAAAAIKKRGERSKPQLVQDVEDDGPIKLSTVGIRSFTEEEAKEIIKAIDQWVFRNNSNKTPWDLIIRFLFWTGCRHGECAALWWNDISDDCSTIKFRFNYSERHKIRKGLKTEGHGADFRTFNCGPALQELLLSIRPEGEFNKKTYVFQNRMGLPVRFGNLQDIWRGKPSCQENYPGILPRLMKEEKVRKYLTPYSTRHTFINLMLSKGASIYEVAAMVGNSAVVIDEHYRTKTELTTVPVEV